MRSPQVDLVDQETLELAQLDVTEHLEHSFLADAPIIPVDSISGLGLSDLREALDAVLDDTPQAADTAQPRLWIDRAFAAKGSGTVVTGTLTGGSLQVDDELVVEPGSRPVRIRAIQSLHQSTKKIGPGNRVAVNLSGLSHDQVRRGDVLIRDGQWHKTTVFDASLQVLDASRPCALATRRTRGLHRFGRTHGCIARAWTRRTRPRRGRLRTTSAPLGVPDVAGRPFRSA